MSFHHVQVPVGKDYRLSAADVRPHINRNTVLIVASSPGFPHGVMDHVAELGKVLLSCALGMLKHLQHLQHFPPDGISCLSQR